MALNAAGLKGGWKTETMPDKGRSMGDFIMTPDGKLVLVNGGSQGFGKFPHSLSTSHEILRPLD